MSSAIGKRYFILFKLINQNPIALYMAIPKPFKISVEFVFSTAFRQRFFPNKKRHYLINFVHVFMAFFQQFEVFFELVGKSEV